MSSWRGVTTGLVLVLCAILAWSDPGYGRSGAHTGSPSRGGSHLYVLLGLDNNSPGLSEFGGRMAQHGIPTTVRNHDDWPGLAQEAIQRYKDGRLRSIMIVGHSLGGGAAVDMAAELGQAGVPVQLVVTLDPVGGSQISSNVRRSVNFLPTGDEDHFSVIAAHQRDLSNYVLGSRGASR
jgi:pimeloyl-ACP methyl ester carboxylesterase